MDVQATTGDIVEGPDTHPDEVGDGTHDRERQQEAYRGEEEPLPALVAEMKAVDPLEGGHLNGQGSPAAGVAGQLVFEDREIRARQRVNVSLESERPVFGWPLAHVVEAVCELLGRHPIGGVEQ